MSLGCRKRVGLNFYATRRSEPNTLTTAAPSTQIDTAKDLLNALFKILLNTHSSLGQRHQVLVVAQVIPKGTPVNSLRRGYRCIVALHHQWCYGRLPLRATRRFLTLLRVPENAEIVRWELDKIRDDWESLEDNDNPCPYTASLLLSCWSAFLEPQKLCAPGNACYLLSPSMGSGDGATTMTRSLLLIDITNCQSPAYCFVSVGGLESRGQVPSWKPLTAKQYCRALLDYSVLADTWSSEYRVKALSAFLAYEVLAHESPILIPSLVDISIEPSIASIIQGGDTSLMRNELSSFPDEAMSLLLDLLNLTYPSLRTAQVLQLLTFFESIEVLNLSHNHLVGIKTVEQILLKHLRRVVLLDCSSFNNEDVASLLSDKHELFKFIDAFIHPYLFSPHPDAPVAFAIASVEMGPNSYWVSVSYISPSRVVQTLIDIITAFVVTVPTLQHCPNKGWMFIISVRRDRGYDSPCYRRAFVDLSESATVGSNPGSPSIVGEDSQPAESTHGAESALSSSAYTDDIQHLEQLMIDAGEILRTRMEKGLPPSRQISKGTRIFEQMTTEDVAEFIRKDDPRRPIY
ncbi:hypothetical protein HETIRDRAFT_423498 [Heterobasidion irregulare TC 32-1]|uniref:Uncharacterized protein n=1 Tax=Heterobasidion irregulare (strain TC 32-1) TaxID=747525 RepID=W4JP77_HETIT|nr:uncharacterized protein HETIRDRAFT_423498 [Heterobasidion irregulare TC 32-1]ETW74885.1 hypothetical protein HETIRDRAFT_423498 [Heterobasidion irregulare TC 32-1]